MFIPFVMTKPIPPLLYPVTTAPARTRRWGVATVYLVLPILVFLYTSLPYVNRFTPIISLLLLALALGARFAVKLPRKLTVAAWVLFVLTLMGSSGWFFSPFFFALYLAAIALGFMYTPMVTIGFTLGLLTIFASSVGEVSPTADFLTLLSLLSVIPITMVLRKSYLLVQQEKKGILILESEERDSGLSSLDAVLTNQVNKIAITIRQPITYIRQGMALLKENTLTAEEYPAVIERMSRAADEVFTLIKEFESDTTQNKLLNRTKVEKPGND